MSQPESAQQQEPEPKETEPQFEAESQPESKAQSAEGGPQPSLEERRSKPKLEASHKEWESVTYPSS